MENEMDELLDLYPEAPDTGVIDPPAETEEEEEKIKKDGDDDGEEEGEERSPASMFLDQYGITGGVIEFEDGTTSNIDDLTPEEQFKIIEHIVNTTRPSVEEQYALTEGEIQALNLMRENNLNLDQIVEQMVEQRLIDIQASSQFEGDIDFEQMDSDEIFLRNLSKENPDYTPEELEEDLEIAKSMKGYEKTVNSIRRDFIHDRDTKKQEWLDGKQTRDNQEIEADTATIVNSVREITEIAGWPIDDQVKNEILADLVETNENRDSSFIANVLSDPKKMFEAQWFLKYGSTLFERMDTYYKSEMKKSFEKGAASRRSGEPRIEGFKKDRPGTETPENKKIKNKSNNLEDLYEK
jgi:hypothetical protein